MSFGAAQSAGLAGLIQNLVAASAASTLGNRRPNRGRFGLGGPGLAGLLANLGGGLSGGGGFNRPAPRDNLGSQLGSSLLQQILASRLGGVGGFERPPRPAPEFFSPPTAPPGAAFTPPVNDGGGLAGLPFQLPAPLAPVRGPTFQAEGVGPATLVPPAPINTGGAFGGAPFGTSSLGIPPGPPPAPDFTFGSPLSERGPGIRRF